MLQPKGGGEGYPGSCGWLMQMWTLSIFIFSSNCPMLLVEDKSRLDLNHELFEEQVMEDTQSKKQKCAAPLHPSHSVHNLPETRMLSSALSSPI